MRDRDSRTRTGAKDPWGREAGPLEQRHVEARSDRDSELGHRSVAEACEGWRKLDGETGMPGAGFTATPSGKVPPERLALKPYRCWLALSTAIRGFLIADWSLEEALEPGGRA